MHMLTWILRGQGGGLPLASFLIQTFSTVIIAFIKLCVYASMIACMHAHMSMYGIKWSFSACLHSISFGIYCLSPEKVDRTSLKSYITVHSSAVLLQLSLVILTCRYFDLPPIHLKNMQGNPRVYCIVNSTSSVVSQSLRC